MTIGLDNGTSLPRGSRQVASERLLPAELDPIESSVAKALPEKLLGDFVGYRLPHTTQIYSKVLVEKLRKFALARGEGAL